MGNKTRKRRKVSLENLIHTLNFYGIPVPTPIMKNILHIYKDPRGAIDRLEKSLQGEDYENKNGGFTGNE